MTVLCPPQVVTAPLTTSPRYGLYSVATVLDDQDRVGCGVVYLGEATAPSGFAWDAQCGERAATKVLGTEPDTVEGSGFWVVSGTTCLRDNIEAEATSRLALTEEQVVEDQIWTGSLGLEPEFDDAGTPVLTPAAVSLVVGVGLLEEYLGSNYAGVGTLHSSRRVAAEAGRDLLVSKSGSKLTTLLDTPWAFGRGYAVNTGPGGVPAPAGQAWIYATGQVVVRRGPIFVSTLADSLDRSTNEIQVIAERPIAVTVDGILAAALVAL